MDILINFVSWVFLIGGCMFCLMGGLGLIRLPDMFARMHGASLIDTMGIGLILIGPMFQAGFTLITGKLILILIFIFFTSPTSTYALARAAINGDLIAKIENDDGTKQEARSSKT